MRPSRDYYFRGFLLETIFVYLSIFLQSNVGMFLRSFRERFEFMTASCEITESRTLIGEYLVHNLKEIKAA